MTCHPKVKKCHAPVFHYEYVSGMQVGVENAVIKDLLHERFSHDKSYFASVKPLLIKQIHATGFYPFNEFQSQHSFACVIPINFWNMNLHVVPEVVCKTVCVPSFMSIIYFFKNAAG